MTTGGDLADRAVVDGQELGRRRAARAAAASAASRPCCSTATAARGAAVADRLRARGAPRSSPASTAGSRASSWRRAIVVICSTVSLFHEVQAWNRAAHPGLLRGVAARAGGRAGAARPPGGREVYSGARGAVVGRELAPGVPAHAGPDHRQPRRDDRRRGRAPHPRARSMRDLLDAPARALLPRQPALPLGPLGRRAGARRAGARLSRGRLRLHRDHRPLRGALRLAGRPTRARCAATTSRRWSAPS